MSVICIVIGYVFVFSHISQTPVTQNTNQLIPRQIDKESCKQIVIFTKYKSVDEVKQAFKKCEEIKD
jgi:hypothetical protein